MQQSSRDSLHAKQFRRNIMNSIDNPSNQKQLESDSNKSFDHSCLFWKTFQIPFSLPPHFIGQFERGIDLHLSGHLCKWNKLYNGVPLAFDQVSIASKTGQIRHPDPHIFFDISFRSLLFAPKRGSILIGRIVELNSDHISLLVYGVFHCSIPVLEIPASYSWSEEQESWICDVDPDPNSETGLDDDSKPNQIVVTQSSFLSFRVESIKVDTHSILSLVGSLC